MCTKIYGCAGFAYDNINKICYLVTKPIVDKLIRSKYRDKYNNNLFICNKIKPLMNSNNIIESTNAHKNNTIYLCKDGIDGFANFKSILDEKITDLKYKNLPIQIKPYKLKQVIWSNTKDLDPEYVNNND